MPIAIQMPALSPTMEEGTLSKWLVKVGDQVSAGDIMAEIETDKATMEFEAVDEGTIAHIAVPEGTEGVAVGTVIATLAEEGEDPKSVKPMGGADSKSGVPAKAGTSGSKEEPPAKQTEAPASAGAHEKERDRAATSEVTGDRLTASPLAKRMAGQAGIDLSQVKGSGPKGRIVKADIEQAGVPAQAGTSGRPAQPGKAPASAGAQDFEIPHEVEKLSSMRKTIARRLTESKQQIPHIYLTVD
ncbi:MAG TPA: biotin/lipoyl-containing protein, partial [Candidatus Methylomirabilis sp.]